MDRQSTDKHPEGHPDRYPDIHIDIQTKIQTNQHPDILDRQASRLQEIKTFRHTYIQADRKDSIKTDIKTK